MANFIMVDFTTPWTKVNAVDGRDGINYCDFAYPPLALYSKRDRCFLLDVLEWPRTVSNQLRQI